MGHSIQAGDRFYKQITDEYFQEGAHLTQKMIGKLVNSDLHGTK